jgi:hypothetical protein
MDFMQPIEKSRIVIEWGVLSKNEKPGAMAEAFSMSD